MEEVVKVTELKDRADKYDVKLGDLNLYLKPHLFIMDGIIAMEGNGPASGDPVFMKTILVSKDPFALDSVFASTKYKTYIFRMW